MKSAHGEPVAHIGPEGQSSYRLSPRVGLYRSVIVVESFAACGGILLSQAACLVMLKLLSRVATAQA